LLVVLALPLSACAVEPSTSTVEGATMVPGQNKIIANKIIANKIIANKLAAAKLAANQLAERELANGNLAVNMTSARELLSTIDGREVFSFIVSCAVPEGKTLVATIDGATFEFPGEIGLYPQWLRHRLDRRGQGWVSACLFARVNANDVPIPISLRGPNPALRVSRDERDIFSVEEGAFYGNLFTAPGEPILWIACRGEGQAAGEFCGVFDRDCTEPDPAHPGLTQCGFVFAGDCGEFARRHACEDFSERGDFYRSCHSSPTQRHGHYEDDDSGTFGYGATDHRGEDTVFREVITTFVVP